MRLRALAAATSVVALALALFQGVSALGFATIWSAYRHTRRGWRTVYDAPLRFDRALWMARSEEPKGETAAGVAAEAKEVAGPLQGANLVATSTSEPDLQAASKFSGDQTEGARSVAETEKQIVEVARNIRTVEGQITDAANNIKDILTELDKEDLTTDKKGRLDLLLRSLLDKEKALLYKEKALLDKEKILMEEKKALMEEKKALLEKETALPLAAQPSLKGLPLSIPSTFNFNVTSWQIGDIVNCSALSEAMLPFGGFPSSLFVREEMKAVWSSMCEGIVENRTKWVLVGSPGVGKSVLAVLLSFHLAKSCNKPVFLARQLKGEGSLRQKEVAICIHPGGEVEGFTKVPEVMFSLDTICSAFEVRHKIVTCVLDGWSQQELAQSEEGRSFGGFNLLATSAQYRLKGQDVRKLIMLPAWSETDLRFLWDFFRRQLTKEELERDREIFEDHYYYSGGSVREFVRPTEEAKTRIDLAIALISRDSCENLLFGYGGSPGSPHDTIRRCYVDVSKGLKRYTSPSAWTYAIDSGYALKLLGGLAPLKVYEQTMAVAKSTRSRAFYGHSFEALVHQVCTKLDMNVTMHVRSVEDKEGGYKDEFTLGPSSKSECVGANLVETRAYLGSRVMNLTHTSYWHPDYPTFPAFDCILCVPGMKTVFYINLSVAKDKAVNTTTLASLHEEVKRSLRNSLNESGGQGDVSGWTFRFVVIEPSSQEADALKLVAEGGDFSDIRDITFGKGFVTYVQR
jgi:hypothetical protein